MIVIIGLAVVAALIATYFVIGKDAEDKRPDVPVIDPRAARLMELRQAYEYAKDALGGQEPTNEQILAVRDALRSVTIIRD